ncbi:unnamed protein product [Ectocarpus sp. CCAP 1310/34]|nr:unnamed protein product [Ectocarpus sp. CCAP 1310/34]
MSVGWQEHEPCFWLCGGAAHGARSHYYLLRLVGYSLLVVGSSRVFSEIQL